LNEGLLTSQAAGRGQESRFEVVVDILLCESGQGCDLLLDYVELGGLGLADLLHV